LPHLPFTFSVFAGAVSAMSLCFLSGQNIFQRFSGQENKSSVTLTLMKIVTFLVSFIYLQKDLSYLFAVLCWWLSGV
jgi:hypothetical protein